MIWQILILVLGFGLLIKGSEILINGSTSIARIFKISDWIISFIFIAIGTSIPEFAIVTKSFISGNTDLILGVVIGSNIFNVLFTLGSCVMARPLKVKKGSTSKELPISVLISCLLIILLSDVFIDAAKINEFTKSDSIIIIMFFSIFIYYLIDISKKRVKYVSLAKLKQSGFFKSLFYVVLGLVGIIIGSSLTVDSIVSISDMTGISLRVLALTVVSIGSSLPELIFTINSMLVKKQEVLISNIIGSNIFNICIVLGLPVLLFGGIGISAYTSIDLIILVISALVLYIFARSENKIKKSEGILMLSCFILYYVYLFLG